MTEKDFIAAIKEHIGIIHKILYLYVDDTEDKLDLKQEIQLQAWKSVDKFRGDSRFSTWLYRVALNTVFTYKRSNRIYTDTLDSEAPIAENKIEQSDQSELLLSAIKRLNDADKTIITLHLEDYSNQEIASITGLSTNNVGVKIHRIKDSLKKKLNPQS